MVEKAIKISCTSAILKSKSFDGVIWRQWRLQINPIQHTSSLDSYIDHVEYFLHESFESPHIVCYEEPFLVQQVGWGAFDLKVVFHFRDVVETSSHTVLFDLNFEKPKYSEYYTLSLMKDCISLSGALKNKRVVKRKREASAPSIESKDDRSLMTRRLSESSESMTSCVCDNRCRSKIDSFNTFNRKQQTGLVTHSSLNKIDIKVLGDGMEALDDENLRKLYHLIFDYGQKNMSIVETEDECLIDLYSLDPSLLTKLWEFTRHVKKKDPVTKPH